MWNDAAPVNRSASKSSAVASPTTTSTLVPAIRSASPAASPSSSSTAVRCAVLVCRMSVVNPGPGPISRASSPSVTPASATGRIVWCTSWRQSSLAQYSMWPGFMTKRSARRLDLVLVLPPARRAHLLGVGAERGVLAEVLRGGPDAIGGRAQRVEVEVVAAGGRLAQQFPGVLHRDAAEVAAQAFLGVRPRALRVRVVGSPHDDVAAQNMTAA